MSTPLWSRRAFCGTLVGAPLALLPPRALAARAVEGEARRLIGARELVEARTILGQVDGAEPVLLSPNGDRYVTFALRGDLRSNGNWLEIFSGRTDTMAAAGSSTPIATLFSTSGFGNPMRHPSLAVHWVDETGIAFPWWEAEGRFTIQHVDLANGRRRTRVRHDQWIPAFGAARSAEVIAFIASRTSYNRGISRGRRAGVVQTLDITPIVDGELDGRGWWNDFEVFVSAEVDAPAHRLEFELGLAAGPPAITVEPGGRWVIIAGAPTTLPEAWSVYRQTRLHGSRLATFQEHFRHAAVHGGTTSRVRRLWVANRDGAVRALWDAPLVPPSSALGFPQGSQWSFSPDGDQLLIWPTFLPDRTIPRGVEGRAVAIVDLVDGEYSAVGFPTDERTPLGITWRGRDELVADYEDGARLVATQAGRDRTWTVRSEEQGMQRSPSRVPLAVEWVQDYATPPALVAREVRSRGLRRVITELNPELIRGHELGRVEPFEWRDSEGRSWTGRLYHPTRAQRGRAPLVVQTHPTACPLTQYHLTGCDFITNAFAAQALTARGFAVLHVSSPDERPRLSTPTERPIYSGGYDAAVTALDAQGLIDPERLGLVGFSRSGVTVAHALAFSSHQWKTAVLSDASDASYYQYLHMPPQIRAQFDSLNGASPLGEGLTEWFKHTPTFNIERIESAVLIERSQGLLGALGVWEFYTNLRALRVPVELYLYEEGLGSAHPLERPRQVLHSKQTTIDWLDFWINGREDADPAKIAQYARWNALRHESGKD